VPAIARLTAADEDAVRDVVHAFNAGGLAALDPRCVGGRPRLVGDDDIQFIVTTATIRLGKLGPSFTHWKPAQAGWPHRAAGADRAGAAAADLARARDLVPADPDLAGLALRNLGSPLRAVWRGKRSSASCMVFKLPYR
jgi:hypothetical protein